MEKSRFGRVAIAAGKDLLRFQVAKMRLPPSRRRLGIEERRVGECRIAMERIAQQNEQRLFLGQPSRVSTVWLPAAISASKICRSSGQSRSRCWGSVALRHNAIITASSAAQRQNPTNFDDHIPHFAFQLKLPAEPCARNRNNRREDQERSQVELKTASFALGRLDFGRVVFHGPHHPRPRAAEDWNHPAYWHEYCGELVAEADRWRRGRAIRREVDLLIRMLTEVGELPRSSPQSLLDAGCGIALIPLVLA